MSAGNPVTSVFISYEHLESDLLSNSSIWIFIVGLQECAQSVRFVHEHIRRSQKYLNVVVNFFNSYLYQKFIQI